MKNTQESQTYDGDDENMIVTASSGDCEDPTIRIWKRRERNKVPKGCSSAQKILRWIVQKLLEVLGIALAVVLIMQNSNINVRGTDNNGDVQHSHG